MSEEEKIKAMIAQISNVLGEVVNSHPELLGIKNELRDLGYDISILSMIVVNTRSGEEIKGGFLQKDGQTSDLNFDLTDADREFLKSIGVRFE